MKRHLNKAVNATPNCVGLGLSLLRSTSPLTRRYIKRKSMNSLTKFIPILFFIVFTGSLAAEEKALNSASYQNLIDGYQSAHQSKDRAALRNLFCLDRVPEDLFVRMLNHLEKGFKRPLQEVLVTQIDPDWPMSYEMNGITYRPNLEPEAQLLIRFEQGSGIKETKLLIGTKDGTRYLITSAPETRP